MSTNVLENIRKQVDSLYSDLNINNLLDREDLSDQVFFTVKCPTLLKDVPDIDNRISICISLIKKGRWRTPTNYDSVINNKKKFRSKAHDLLNQSRKIPITNPSINYKFYVKSVNDSLENKGITLFNSLTPCEKIKRLKEQIAILGSGHIHLQSINKAIEGKQKQVKELLKDINS